LSLVIKNISNYITKIILLETIFVELMRKKYIHADYIGKKFNRVTILEIFNKLNDKGKVVAKMAKCECDCGKVFDTVFGRIMTEVTRSCGCWTKDRVREVSKTHGLNDTRLYREYWGMRQRQSKSNKHREYYTHIDKIVCDEWVNDFMAFYNWAMTNGYSDELTIDRIDNSKGYSPENCRWATEKEQGRNKRNNVLITLNGETRCVSEWAEITGIDHQTIYTRVKKGKLTPEQILSPSWGYYDRKTHQKINLPSAQS
jgi:hypothetical protein